MLKQSENHVLFYVESYFTEMLLLMSIGVHMGLKTFLQNFNVINCV